MRLALALVVLFTGSLIASVGGCIAAIAMCPGAVDYLLAGLGGAMLGGGYSIIFYGIEMAARAESTRSGTYT